MTVVNVLRPEIVGAFKCSGSKCKDTCCYGWEIAIDKETFNKYKKLKDHRFIGIANNISKVRSKRHKFRYGRIKNGHAGCPYVTEQGLCGIQQELGEGYLSVTCSMFPRVYSTVNGLLEQSLVPACEEVAKLLVNHKEKLEFEVVEQDIDFERIAIGYTYNSDIVWNIREFIIDTLQDRSMSIELRLFKIVNCINRIQISSDNYLKAIEVYKGITSDEMRALFDKVNVEENKQLDLFKDIVNLRLDMGISNKRYIQLVKDVFKSMGYVENYDEKVYDHYKMLKKHYDEKYKDYEYVFENVLVQYVFGMCAPFDTQTIMDSIIFMVTNYFLLKNHIIGTSKQKYGNKTEEDLVYILSGFSRVYINNKRYKDAVIEGLNKNGLYSLQGILIMLK